MNLLAKFVSFCLLLSISIAASAQDKPRWEQLSNAYGFVLGQNISLELIEKRFPNLAGEAKQASSAFNASVFGESAKGVESEMAAFFADKWPEMKQQIDESARKNIEAKEFSAEEAKNFIKDVQGRSKGKLPETVRAVLLSANPRFVAEPVLEMRDGWTQIFSTKGLPKAKGINLSIAFPESWTGKDSESPNTIKMFQNNVGTELILCFIFIDEFPLPPDYKLSRKEIDAFLKTPKFMKLANDKDIQIIETKFTSSEGKEPAGLMILDHRGISDNIPVDMRAIQYFRIQGNFFINIRFIIPKKTPVLSEGSFDSLQKKYIPLFEEIIKTLKTK